MSIRGRLIADFESFYTAVDKAEVKMRDFEGGAAGVTRQLNTLADSFSGRKVIQQATLTSEAIERIGGVSKLSTDEAARGLRDIEQGFEKMLKTGEQIPTSMMKTAAELRKVGRATADADVFVGKITSNFKQFDGILQSVGINARPYVNALEDISGMITKGLPGLGAFGAAAAIVGTALASWKLGTHIGEVTGWTKAIADGWAVLRGFGDVQQQAAMAVADAADAAGKAEANWKKQAEGTAAAAKAAKEHTEAMQREGMGLVGNAAHMEALANQIENLKEKRKADAIETFKASQAQSVFGEKAHFTTEVIVQQTNAIDDHLKKVAEQSAAMKKATDDFMNAPTLNDRVNAPTSFDLPALTSTDLSGLRKKYDPFNTGAPRDTGIWTRLQQLEKLEGTYAPKSRDQYLTMLSDMRELQQLRNWAQDKERPPGYAAGVQNAPGGVAVVGEAGPELVNLPGGSDVIPNHKLGGTTIVVEQHFHGPTFGTKEEFKRQVKDTLTEIARQSGARWRYA